MEWRVERVLAECRDLEKLLLGKCGEFEESCYVD